MTIPNGLTEFLQKSQKVFKDKQITLYKDDVGYSLISEYTKSYRAQMAVKNGVNIVPFFKFYIDEDLDKVKDEYVPLTITARLTSVDNSGEKPRYMLNDSRVKRLHPIELMSRDDFYVNLDDGKTYEKTKNDTYIEIPLLKIYERVYAAHVSSIFSLKGLDRRLEMLITRYLPSRICAGLYYLSGLFHWFLKGTRYTYDVIAESFEDTKYDVREVVPRSSSPDDIKFFGYKVGIWSLFTYSVVIVIIYLLFGESSLLKLKADSALSGIYSISLPILTIVIYDKILPILTQYIVVRMAKLSYELKYKSISIDL